LFWQVKAVEMHLCADHVTDDWRSGQQLLYISGRRTRLCEADRLSTAAAVIEEGSSTSGSGTKLPFQLISLMSAIEEQIDNRRRRSKAVDDPRLTSRRSSCLMPVASLIFTDFG
jgi:hypothetical protein